MRKLMFLVTFAVMCAFALMAQYQTSTPDQQPTTAEKKQAKAEKKEAKAAEKGKAMHLTGWVKTEGGKTVFVNDKDKETWNVSNPDLLTQHEGKHVSVKAKINETDKTLTIESVKEMKKGKQSAETQKKEKS